MGLNVSKMSTKMADDKISTCLVPQGARKVKLSLEWRTIPVKKRTEFHFLDKRTRAGRPPNCPEIGKKIT